MSAITVENDLVHYEVLGRGRPVIFVHGWLGSWRYWVPTMQQLSVKYRTYALDLWGFGDSGKDNNHYGLKDQVQLLHDFMEKLGITKAALVGHSLGAAICLRFAMQYPDRAPRVALISPPLYDLGGLDDHTALGSGTRYTPPVATPSPAPVKTPAPALAGSAVPAPATPVTPSPGNLPGPAAPATPAGSTTPAAPGSANSTPPSTTTPATTSTTGAIAAPSAAPATPAAPGNSTAPSTTSPAATPAPGSTTGAVPVTPAAPATPAAPGSTAPANSASSPGTSTPAPEPTSTDTIPRNPFRNMGESPEEILARLQAKNVASSSGLGSSASSQPGASTPAPKPAGPSTPALPIGIGTPILPKTASLSPATPVPARTDAPNPLLKILSGKPADLLTRYVDPHAPDLDKLRAEVEKTDEAAISKSALSFTGVNLAVELQRLPASTLLLHGKDDPLFPAPSDDLLLRIEKGKPTGHLLALVEPGLRHFPMLEITAKFNRLLLDFLDAQDLSNVQFKDQWRRTMR